MSHCAVAPCTERLNCPYDMLGSINSGDRPFPILGLGLEAANVPSSKELSALLTTGRLVSAERRGVTQASVSLLMCESFKFELNYRLPQNRRSNAAGAGYG